MHLLIAFSYPEGTKALLACFGSERHPSCLLIIGAVVSDFIRPTIPSKSTVQLTLSWLALTGQRWIHRLGVFRHTLVLWKEHHWPKTIVCCLTNMQKSSLYVLDLHPSDWFSLTQLRAGYYKVTRACQRLAVDQDSPGLYLCQCFCARPQQKIT